MNKYIVSAVIGVTLLASSKKVINDSKDVADNKTKYAPVIAAAEKKHGIPSGMLFRLINEESHFRTDIITGKTKSKAGALGIAQFMPATAREELGSVNAALNPTKAIDGAGRYLAKLHKQFGKNWTKAVGAYNWGSGNVQKKGLAAAPEETRNYIAAIIA